MTPDWLEPARSIPVWVGCWVRSDGKSISDLIVSASHGDYWMLKDNSGETRLVRKAYIAPDLSNPDTFAAARDRLAVAMGGSAERVREGTLFQVDGGRWVLYAGMGTYRLDMDEFYIPVDASRELALALAWQKVVGS